jgi:hypothetical protein
MQCVKCIGLFIAALMLSVGIASSVAYFILDDEKHPEIRKVDAGDRDFF